MKIIRFGIKCERQVTKMEAMNNVPVTEEMRGKGVAFDRIRRITGYLVGTMDKWNDGKAAEERDRVKHGIEFTAESNQSVMSKYTVA
jgi:ribonucleoside-triphosphate reductase